MLAESYPLVAHNKFLLSNNPTPTFDVLAATQTLQAAKRFLSAHRGEITPEHDMLIALRNLYRRVIAQLALPTRYDRFQSLRRESITFPEREALNTLAAEITRVLRQFDPTVDVSAPKPHGLLNRVLGWFSREPSSELVDGSSAYGNVSSVIADPTLATRALRAARPKD